jgi:uncharacterized protein (TIGR03083 family)
VDYVASIKQNSARVAALAVTADFSTLVPSCPEWTFGDLVFHLGSVQRFWAATVNARNPNASLTFDDGDVEDAVLVTWAREQTVALVDALSNAPADAPCWTWWGEPRTTGAVARHQVQESAVHCWDACHAVGEDFVIPRGEAIDGVSEFLLVMAPKSNVLSSHYLSFEPVDGTEVLTWGDRGLAPIRLRALTSDLVLVLYGRKPLDNVQVEGDRAVVQRWLDAMDLS